jgi:uncharacterized protein (DUF1499 family)
MADLTPANDVGPAVKVPGTKRRKLRRILLKLSLALTIIGPLIFIMAALGAKLGLWSWQFGLGTLTRQVGPLVLMVGAGVALISLIAAIIVQPRKGIVIAAIGLLVPGLAFAKLKQTTATVAKLPFIHDVTTDTQNPPVFGSVIMAERAATDGVNTADYIGKKAPVRAADGTRSEKLVSVLQTKAYPEIRPLVLTDAQDVVFGKAIATAKAMGWVIKDEAADKGRIDATDTTFWYGFEDDITIRLRPSEGGGTIVDVRSLSRVGGSDLGKNAARVGEFLERLGE